MRHRPRSRAPAIAHRAGRAAALPAERHQARRPCDRGAALRGRRQGGFAPASGDIVVWRPGESEGVRVDHGLAEGVAVSPYYDSLLAKFIAHGRTREEARRRLVRALERTLLAGVVSNRDFLIEALQSPSSSKAARRPLSSAICPRPKSPRRTRRRSRSRRSSMSTGTARARPRRNGAARRCCWRAPAGRMRSRCAATAPTGSPRSARSRCTCRRWSARRIASGTRSTAASGPPAMRSGATISSSTSTESATISSTAPMRRRAATTTRPAASCARRSAASWSRSRRARATR